MDIYAKGQLSYLILNCLLERDFYGLDIISEISDRSNGRINLKKPSVYSNLTRMEKAGQVSSYTRSSDLGPNRRYYSVTEKGRNYFAELKEYFERNHIDVFKDFQTEEEVQPASILQQPVAVEQAMQEEDELMEEETFKQDDFFDFSSIDGSSEKTEPVKVEEEKEPVQAVYNASQSDYNTESVYVEEPVYNQTHQAIYEQVETPALQEVKEEEQVISKAWQEPIQEKLVEEPKRDDAAFLPKNEITDPNYNQKIYDITRDFNRYRRKRSFAEDQMAFEVNDAAPSFQEAEMKKQQNLEDLKSALLESKGKVNEVPQHFFNPQTVQPQPAVITPKQEQAPEVDDGVFITGHIENREFLKTRKIEPPRLKIVSDNVPLPAPKRDTTIDPSHKEIIEDLYAKSKDTSEEQVNTLYDYDDLEDYYKSQHIIFKTYKHGQKDQLAHNTNKLNLIISSVTFALLCIITATMFGVLYSKHLTNPNTSFIYIILPGVCLIDVIVKATAMKGRSWEPKPMPPQWFMWLMWLFTSGVIVGLNFAFGLSAETFMSHFAALVYPLSILVVTIPFHYYLKRGIYIKHWH